MKASHLLLAGAVLFALGGGTLLHSQQAAPAPQTLHEAKARNQKLIEQQAATLQKLDELEKSAAQMRIFARRS